MQPEHLACTGATLSSTPQSPQSVSKAALGHLPSPSEAAFLPQELCHRWASTLLLLLPSIGVLSPTAGVLTPLPWQLHWLASGDPLCKACKAFFVPVYAHHFLHMTLSG